MNTPLVSDSVAPTVSITAPIAGTVSGTINVTANAADNVGVVGVQFILDGVALGAEDVASPYSVSWLDGRNNSSFGNMSWSNNQLTFDITARSNATNIRAMLPLNSQSGTLISITRNGNSVSFTTQTIKGMQYAFFAPVTGTSTYVATYSSGARIANPVTTETLVPVTTQTAETSRKVKEETILAQSQVFNVNVIPNPSTDNFSVFLSSSDANPVTVRVTDIFGRLIETHEKVTSTGVLKLGQNWRSGIYFAEVIHGSQRRVVKLIKTN